MIKKFIYFIFFGIFLILTDLSSVGISTDFNNILIENLQIGREYNLTTLAGLPMKVKNISEMKLKIKVEPVFPAENYLREGFEVIPDTSWIKLSNTEFDVSPGEYAVLDVIISIPEDDKYLGKKYQVHLWSRAQIESGNLVSVMPGIEGILMFTLAPERVKSKIEPIDLNFHIEPNEIYEKIDFSEGLISEIKIKNLSKKPLLIEISQTDAGKVGMRLKEGYEVLTDTSCLYFIPQRFKLGYNKEKKVKVYIKIDREKFVNKKFMSAISVNTKAKGISGKKFVKLFLEIL